ncbi:hypothetical protein R5R35_000141 [Gryllus longicercus]|uniref:Uncharacterized protein n=1 Tax=Gryllus longicercus TaxID=2509291 RepID=A0AAN9VJY7_9ORTH
MEQVVLVVQFGGNAPPVRGYPVGENPADRRRSVLELAIQRGKITATSRGKTCATLTGLMTFAVDAPTIDVEPNVIDRKKEGKRFGSSRAQWQRPNGCGANTRSLSTKKATKRRS